MDKIVKETGVSNHSGHRNISNKLDAVGNFFNSNW